MLFISKLHFFDFENYFALVKDKQVMSMITESGLSEKEARIKFDEIVRENDLHPDYGYYKITDIHENFIGVIKLEISDPHPVEAELGYMLKPKFWGKGIGNKTSRFLIEKAKQFGQLKRIFAVIDPSNLASKKILTNNGFVSVEFQDLEKLPSEILELKLRP